MGPPNRKTRELIASSKELTSEKVESLIPFNVNEVQRGRRFPRPLWPFGMMRKADIKNWYKLLGKRAHRLCGHLISTVKVGWEEKGYHQRFHKPEYFIQLVS